MQHCCIAPHAHKPLTTTPCLCRLGVTTSWPPDTESRPRLERHHAIAIEPIRVTLTATLMHTFSAGENGTITLTGVACTTCSLAEIRYQGRRS